jgi:hypothetical protein
MTHSSEHILSGAARRPSALVQALRGVYLALAVLFTVGVALQVFFAGAGVLVSPQYFAMHANLGHMLELLPLLLIIFGIAGRLSWRLVGLAALTLVLFMMQYMFLYGIGRLTGMPALRALHAVNALALFWLGLHQATRVWALLRDGRRTEQAPVMLPTP